VLATDLATLQPEVRDHEPHIALTDGGSGLSLIDRIVSGAPEYLRPGGFLAIEFGFGQSSAVIEMFDRTMWSSIELIKDLNGIDRTALAVRS
jgi:release factor glutamine methyltransferase